MGTITRGILGGFSGKVGTVVGSNWKGTSYMRALALKVKDANTEKQRYQRNKFIITHSFLKTMTPFIRFGYRGYAKRQSEYNAATSYVMKHAMADTKGTPVIDYDKVLLTRGTLTTAANPAAVIAESKASYTWTDNSGTGDAQATDRAMLLVYNKKKNEAVYDVDAAARSAGKAQLDLPAAWSGDALAVYIGFRSEDDRSVANSACLKNDAFSTGSEEQGGGQPGSESGGGENPLG